VGVCLADRKQCGEMTDDLIWEYVETNRAKSFPTYVDCFNGAGCRSKRKGMDTIQAIVSCSKKRKFKEQ
jgi:hypothetical protein